MNGSQYRAALRRSRGSPMLAGRSRSPPINLGLSGVCSISIRYMAQAVGQAGGRLDGIFFCPHTASSRCPCRKPAAGLFHDIAHRFKRDLKGTPVIGDSLRDLQAGEGCGCDLWLVKTGKGLRTISAADQDPEKQLPKGTQIVADLATAVDQILAKPPTPGH